MVAVSLNSIDFVGGQPALRYKYYDHNITAISPTGGPVRGGTRVTVSGVAFDAFNGEPLDLRCRFGTRPVPGAPGTLMPNQTVCIAPPHHSIAWDETDALDSPPPALPPPAPPAPAPTAVFGRLCCVTGDEADALLAPVTLTLTLAIAIAIAPALTPTPGLTPTLTLTVT